MSSTVRLTSADPGSGNPENGAPAVVIDIDLAHGGRIGQISVGDG